MVDVLLTVFWGVVLLSLLVVIHEGGHYFAARAFGVRVLEFMVGLPGPSIGFRPRKSRTRFGVTAIPLGGYARIAGMDEHCDQEHLPEVAAMLYKMGSVESGDLEAASEQVGFDIEDSLETLCEWGTVAKRKTGRDGACAYETPEIEGHSQGEPREIGDPRAFIREERSQTYIALPWWKRLVVLAAGPGANLLTAIVVVTLTLSLVGGSQATLTLSEVTEQQPAYAAGLRAGDTITAVGGTEVATWAEFTSAVGELQAGDTVAIGYTRDGQQNVVDVQVATSETTGKPVIGVVAGTEQVKLAPWDAFVTSLSYIGQVTVAIVQLVNPATTMQVIDQSSSLIGISVVAKQAADLGFVNFMWLAAVISISLGLMNLLPLMPLDGGHIVVQTIQRIRGKILSERAVSAYAMAGIFLVMALFVMATGNDIGNLASGGF